MIAGALVILVLSQPYVRSRVDADAGTATPQCLWWREDTTITWQADSEGNPVNGGAEIAAFEKAFATWQAQMDACGSLAFAEGARTAIRTVGYSPNGTNHNGLLFRFKDCHDTVASSDACWNQDRQDCGNRYDCWQFSRSAIAITTTSYEPSSGRILDADIEFNTPGFTFTTVDAPACLAAPSQSCVSTDLQNTTTHEVGHLLGLAHSSNPSSTMYKSASPGDLSKRVLDPGTRQFVCDVYPKGGLSKTCVTPLLTSDLGSAGCAVSPWGSVALGAAVVLSLRRRRG